MGSQIQAAPTQVKIWFTEKLEPALSKIQVFDSSGLEVDKRDVKIDQLNAALLIVSLPKLNTRSSGASCQLTRMSQLETSRSN